ncbi:uncharacterized protein LOC132701723 [Cylas formicarius]|uniref:uncharacterized protein LOC132701723 n=1 Tax=Cylas formicarius TaxID=197179 RepID=UPI00295884C0|nr:uncharacterized protein LOC132701723 [Cylas formicarius]
MSDGGFLGQLLLQQVRSSLYGVTFAMALVSSNCAMCNLFGRVHYYNIGLVSGVISGLALLIETEENKNLDALIFVNMVLESAFRNGDHFNVFKLTPAREVLAFVVISAFLMQLLQTRNMDLQFTHFWFYVPLMPIRSGEDIRCAHRHHCLKYMGQGVAKYFGLGFALSIIKKLIPNLLLLHRAPRRMIRILFNKHNVSFGAFMGAYVGLYRMITCTLIRRKGPHRRYLGLIAGLISSTAYALSPNLQVLVVGITTVLQLLYHSVVRKAELISGGLLRQIIFMLSNGLLMHNAILAKPTCPRYYANMVDVVSNNLFLEVYKKLVVRFVP